MLTSWNEHEAKSAQNTWGGHRCNRCPPSVFMIFEIEDTFTKSCGYLQRAVLPESPAVLQGLWSAHLLPDTGSGIGSETSRPCYSRLSSVPRWFGPNVMIGLGKIRSYQWFAGRLQEVLSILLYDRSYFIETYPFDIFCIQIYKSRSVINVPALQHIS